MNLSKIPLLLRTRAVGTVGGVLVAAGLVVTAVAWAGVRTADNVPAQVPVVLSGGLIALACFIVGGLLLHADIVTGRIRPSDAAEVHLDGAGPGRPGDAEARRRAAVLARHSS
ncbi:MAG TPA: hypothetical protein VGP90_03075 [Acidimicrobiia bacterium]|nr:hypothetical protein [Acidimicrobiia bacterium]